MYSNLNHTPGIEENKKVMIINLNKILKKKKAQLLMCFPPEKNKLKRCTLYKCI